MVARVSRPDDSGRAEGDMLPADVLVRRAETELARAGRYHRPLAVVIVRLPPSADLAVTTRVISRALRRWDLLGAAQVGGSCATEGEYPDLAAVLPETDELGAYGLVRRLATRLPDCSFGIAGFSTDGDQFPLLVEHASATALRGDQIPLMLPVTPPVRRRWRIRLGSRRARHV